MTNQILGVGDAFSYRFVQLLRLFNNVRVVSVDDVLGASIFQQVSCRIGESSVLIVGLFVLCH